MESEMAAIGLSLDELSECLDAIPRKKTEQLLDILDIQPHRNIGGYCPVLETPVITPCALSPCAFNIDDAAALNCLLIYQQMRDEPMGPEQVAQMVGREPQGFTHTFNSAMRKLCTAAVWRVAASELAHDRDPVLVEGRCHVCGRPARDGWEYPGQRLVPGLSYCSAACALKKPPFAVLCEYHGHQELSVVLRRLLTLRRSAEQIADSCEVPLSQVLASAAKVGMDIKKEAELVSVKPPARLEEIEKLVEAMFA